MRSYSRHIIREGWSERDVREELRQSPEYQSTMGRTSSADRIMRRAYQEILNREPDLSGLDTYRRAIIEDGWDEQDLRQVLRPSGESPTPRVHVRQCVVLSSVTAPLHRLASLTTSTIGSGASEQATITPQSAADGTDVCSTLWSSGT